ncbi:Plasmid maintenance system killer protein [Symmachiella macrocystis]|uniref:Plasmid maintenance system killer protein n=1 Tax=Symmachiella macrocystis TaxID=2527985 RepID=A0A5C6BMC3_9PLAN|nr:type II toxin-antitoxin system RelE/ParE family toxin [Symmachiella macrocystis]TWU13165.1 Plasmid maintenance system killer protein [Symmachiella macrocystis]
MDVEFSDSGLGFLEADPAAKTKLAPNVVRAYRKVMNIIRSAEDERDIRAMKSLRLEKLKGRRKHQHSLRLNDQMRLIIEFNLNTVLVVAVEDYH